MGQIIDFETIKNNGIQKKHFIYLIFAIIIIYILYSIYLLVKTPNDTIIIEKGTVTQEESGVGYILRDETVLTGNNYKNNLTPIVAEGERAAKGQTIFRYSGANEEETKAKIAEINLKIQEAMSKQIINLPTDVKNLEKQIDEKTAVLKTLTDIHTISEYKKEIEEIVNKKAKITGSLSKSGSYIKELNNEKEQLEKRLTEDSEYMISPMAGVVSYRVDGLEESLNISDFSNITGESLENLELKTGKIVSTSNESRKSYKQF